MMDINSSMEKNGSHNGDVSKHYRVSPLAQALLEKHDIPFVGLQYVVEVQQAENPDVDSSYYVCALCGKKMSSKTLVAHIKSVPHRLKFTEHHCPKLHATYGTIQIKEWTAALVKEFSEEMVKVSKNLGRFQMAVCKEHEMNNLLAVVKENIGNLDKFRGFMGTAGTADASQSSGGGRDKDKTAGLPDFLRQKLKQGLKRDSPTAPQARGRERSPSVPGREGPSPKKIRSGSVGATSCSSGGARSRPGSRSPAAPRNASPARLARHDGDRSAAVAAFRKDFENFYSRHSEREMYYKKNPESHPGYSSEWKIFWERRYQELAAKGLDPNKHDFKSEWAMFWNDRMKDIFSAAVENKKEALLRKHKICKEDLEEKRPVSPWEDSESQNVRNNDFSVIGTLQALTEVETSLGAFGPAINTLLKKALSYQADRKNPWDIFSDSDSVTLIKLSVDKLSGSVSSGGNSSSVCRKNAVECAKWLLDQVGLRKEEENFLGLNMKELAEKTLGMDTVQIAQQIALSLLKIGKSNASEDDLQKILLAVSASHAKLLLEQQSKQPSSSVPSQNTTHQTSVGKPLFPSAAFSFEAKASTSVNDTEVKPTNEKKSPSSNDACTSSGALGQLISAYDDEEPVRDMEKLSLDDLVNLLSNFKDLSGDEQQALTAYLKRLEATDTKKVTKLRELVQKKRETLTVVRKTVDTSGIKNKSKITDSLDGSCSTDRSYAPERVTNPDVRSFGNESTSPHESTKSGVSSDHKNSTEPDLRGGKCSTQTASSISDERSPECLQNENQTRSSEPNGDARHQVSYSSASCPRSVHGSPASVRSSRERSVSRTRDSQGPNNELNYSEDRQPFLRSSSVHRCEPEVGDRRDSHPMHPRGGYAMQSVAARPAHSEVNDEIYQRENSSIARADHSFHPHESIRHVRPIYPGDDPSAYPLDLPMHSRIDTALHYRDGRPVQRDGLPLQPRDDSPMHQRIGFPMHRRSISPMHSRGSPAVYPREGPPMYHRNSPPEHLREGPLAYPRANPLGYPVDDTQMQLRGAPPSHHRHNMPGEDSRMYPHDDFTTHSDIPVHRWNDRENFKDEPRIRPLMELDPRSSRSSVNPWESSHTTAERPFVDRVDSVPQHLKMETMPTRNEPFLPRGGRPVDDYQLRNFPQDPFDGPRSDQPLRSHPEMTSSNPRILPCPIGPLDPAISSDSRVFDGPSRSGSAEIFSRETSDHMRGGFARDAVHPTISRPLSHDIQGSRNPYAINDSNRLHSNVFEHDVSRPYPKPRDEPQSDHPFDKFVMNREAEGHGVRPFSRNQRGGFPPSQHDRTSGQFPFRR